jgi:hypothetical protein
MQGTGKKEYWWNSDALIRIAISADAIKLK